MTADLDPFSFARADAGDDEARSLLREWVAVNDEADRLVSYDDAYSKSPEYNAAIARMNRLEDAILEIEGGAVAAAIKIIG
jgi:hypothetical protein